MKKKILSLVLAAATCFSLTACNQSTTPESGNQNTGDANTTTAPTGT